MGSSKSGIHSSLARLELPVGTPEELEQESVPGADELLP
jgi:hypothetical protein